MTSINYTSTWQCGSACVIRSILYSMTCMQQVKWIILVYSGNSVLIAHVLKKLLKQLYSEYFVISMLWTTET